MGKRVVLCILEKRNDILFQGCANCSKQGYRNGFKNRKIKPTPSSRLLKVPSNIFPFFITNYQRTVALCKNIFVSRSQEYTRMYFVRSCCTFSRLSDYIRDVIKFVVISLHTTFRSVFPEGGDRLGS
jgi:hypothetical protein